MIRLKSAWRPHYNYNADLIAALYRDILRLTSGYNQKN